MMVVSGGLSPGQVDELQLRLTAERGVLDPLVVQRSNGQLTQVMFDVRTVVPVDAMEPVSAVFAALPLSARQYSFGIRLDPLLEAPDASFRVVSARQHT